MKVDIEGKSWPKKLQYGDLSINVLFYLRSKSIVDLDNMLKPLFDGLRRGGVFKDNNQIKKLRVKIIENSGSTRIDIVINKIY